jgi:integral membrane sensor domain MASE1
VARNLLDRLVGPLTPGRIGAVLGVVVAAAGTYLWAWATGGLGNLTGMLAIFFVGPIGAVLGFVVGRMLRPALRASKPRDVTDPR